MCLEKIVGRHSSFSLITALSAGAILFLSCEKASSPTPPLSDFYLSSQLAGWVPDSTTPLDILPVDKLYGPLDGGADPFDKAGLLTWFHEKMNGGTHPTASSGDYLFDGYVHDYGTPEKARALFAKKVASDMPGDPLDTASGLVRFSTFPDSEAQGKMVLEGVMVEATFGQYYFEFNLVGYTDPGIAVAEAGKFLSWYKAAEAKQRKG